MERINLIERYEQEIRNDWDWTGIKQEAMENFEMDDCEQQLVGKCWLGTVFGITPSGKVYAPWTTNQTSFDVARDYAFVRALNNVAESHGMWIDTEDDFFACLAIDPSEFDDQKHGVLFSETLDQIKALNN